MKRFVLCILFILSCLIGSSQGQGFEWSDRQENIQAGLGQSIRVPIRIKNTSDKPQSFTVRKAHADLGASQKAYFCLGDECYDPTVDQVSKRIEAGETLGNLYYVIQTGLIS